MRYFAFHMDTHISGFTLVELLLTLSIIAILMSILIPNVLNARERAIESAAHTYGRQMSTWAMSWLMANQARRTTDLPSQCTDTIYIQEGALRDAPVGIQSCAVTGNADGTFIIKIVSSVGSEVITRQ